MRIKILFYSSLLILIISCGTNKKYYYVEEGKEEKLIESSSDSAAYIEAYTNFQISKTVYKQMKEEYGTMGLSESYSFSLFDENHKEIFPSFLNKDKIEKEIEIKINNMPNNVAESAQRAREERNGKGAKYDTAGLYLSPIKILNSRFVSKEYSNYKDVSLKYKNVSKKRVSAIRFKWYGVNAFNEPADVGGVLSNGWGGGFDDEGLAAGSVVSNIWNVLSKDGKKILIAYPYEVAFEDGSKWKLNNN